MTSAALALTLVAAVLHATWNISLKRSRDRIAFAAAMLLACGVALLPWSMSWAASGMVLPAVWRLLAVSVGAEFAYYLCLASGYGTGELSLVYPIARGTGAMATALAGRVLLGEHPTSAGAVGIGLVGGGLLLIGIVSARRGHAHRASVLFALGAGACISIYSVADKTAVGQTPVVPFMGSMYLLTGIAMTIFALGRASASAREEWHANWRMAVGAGLMSGLTYALVLVAMTMTHVGYVAAVRESSMLFALGLAWFWLREEPDHARTAGAVLMVGGVAAIALGG